ncbi:hypothetical protein [Inovirus D_HF2_82]|nr:hypothetical protein [Inovirus D_HF2_82]
MFTHFLLIRLIRRFINRQINKINTNLSIVKRGGINRPMWVRIKSNKT